MPDQWQQPMNPNVILFRDKYKVQGALRLQSNGKCTFAAVLDTDTGPNILHPIILPMGWERIVQARKLRRITDGSRIPMVIQAILPLHNQLGHMKVRTQFLVCRNLRAEAIFGIRFIDRYVKAIHPESRRVLFYQWTSLAIVGASLGPAAQTPAMNFTENTLSHKIRIGRASLIPPMNPVGAPAVS